MSNAIKVMVAIPNIGATPVESYCNRLVNFMALGKLEQRGCDRDETPRFQFQFTTIGRILTPVARDQAAKMAISEGSDYLYMIDDDMICPDDLFERLYAHNVDIVAPLAFTRNPPYKPVLYSCVEGWDSIANKDYFMNTSVMNYPKDTLVECDAVGFGAVLIKRWVLEGLKGNYFMSTCGTGEDIYFCYQAKKIGARVFMDTATKLGHVSHPTIVTEELVEDYRKTDKDFNKRHLQSYVKDTKVNNEAVLVLGN